MLQRVITATGQALIWGEAGGAVDRLADAYACYEQMLGPGERRFKHGFGGNGATEYAEFKAAGKEGFNKWIACMNPPAETFVPSFRSFLDSTYASATLALGYSRWGIKEVQSRIEAAHFLRLLYPDAKFIFLVRHPFSCLTSIKQRNWLDRPEDQQALEHYGRHWLRLASEFRQSGFGQLVKYEDLVLSPQCRRNLARISEFPGSLFASRKSIAPTGRAIMIRRSASGKSGDCRVSSARKCAATAMKSDLFSLPVSVGEQCIDTPAISVVMPNYNGARLILRSIDSVLLQTFQDLELIIIDDGSKDESVALVNGLSDKRVRLIQQLHEGVCSAHNRGIQSARGTFIAFLDSDDTWAPPFLERLHQAILECRMRQ